MSTPTTTPVDAAPGPRIEHLDLLRPPTRVPYLFRRYPDLAEALPFVPLTRPGPTPVERLAPLADAWGLPALYVKRDDQTSALYGGNKARKLEWILASARALGARSVLTLGAIGSHHAYATAVFAGHLGMHATLVLIPRPPTEHAARVHRATEATGARTLRVPTVAAVPFAASRGRLADWLGGHGWPHTIRAGGSCLRGVLGYVDAALELASQIQDDRAPVPDYVYVAAGTCGTLAGLSVGLQLAAAEVPALARTTVVGVQVVPSVIASRRHIDRLRRSAARLLCNRGVCAASANGPIAIVRDQLGRGYGHSTAAAEQALEAGVAAGLPMETTYTAKALAGLSAFASAPARRGATHLYVHTLGRLPATGA